jgi:nucleoside-diphosphate-sugar epimerase
LGIVNETTSSPRRTASTLDSAAPLLGPIAITGASGQVGNALRRRLAAVPDMRALGRADDLEGRCRDASVVVHLAGTLRPDRGSDHAQANLETVRRTLAALAGSSVERVIFLSSVGADPGSPNGYLRAKGEAERLLHESGLDVVVLRCTHIFGPPDDPGPTVSALQARGSGSVWVLGNGSQRVAPVYREDVVDAIVAALDPRTFHGRFDLPGPEEMSMDDFVRIVNRDGVRVRHLPASAARWFARVAPGLDANLADVMVSDNLGEQRRADHAFGLERHGPTEIYGRPAAASDLSSRRAAPPRGRSEPPPRGSPGPASA